MAEASGRSRTLAANQCEPECAGWIAADFT